MRRAWLRGQRFARSCFERIRHGAAHVAATLLDGFAAITGFYYSKKYAAIARRLGLRSEALDAGQPGLIVIQIDGLSHDYLQQAVDKGRLPRIKRMLTKDGYCLAQWRCGLPSCTPASQAGIMFGDNDDIPAFRWYDKQHGTSLVCKLPGVLALLQSRVSRKHPGLLTGGASYVNLFDGGASDSLFTLSDLQPRHFFEGVQGLAFVGLFLLNPLRSLNMLYLIVKEYVTDLLQRLGSRLQGESYLPFFGVDPLLRIFSNVILREVETFAVLVDVYRGVPAIYATYSGYDELAHHFGADSMAARQALRDIDHRIGQIQRLCRANLSRPYAIVLLSDHGQTPSQPFAQRFNRSLGDHISEQLGEKVLLVEHADGEQQYLGQTHFLLDELRANEKHMRPIAARVARRTRILVQRRLALGRSEMPAWDLSRQFDVVVKSSGSLAHVYFNISSRRLDLSEVSAAFPGLVVRLLAHDGIWMIVAREGQQTLLMAREGILTLDDTAGGRVEGQNPLLRLAEPEEAAQQVRRVASFPSCGDLMLFGAYDPAEDLVVCFENQWGSHGGLGGAQDRPFIVYPQRFEWDLSRVHNSTDIYALLAKQRGWS